MPQLRRGPGTLRARLALLTALIVAAGIALASGVAYVATRAVLLRQVDQALLDGPGSRPRPPESGTLTARRIPVGRVFNLDGLCTMNDRVTLQPFVVGLEVLRPNGSVCTPPGGAYVGVLPADRKLAAAGKGSLLRDTQTSSGMPVRLLVRPSDHGYALLTFRSLVEVRRTLDRLALALAVLTALGAVGSAAVGLLLARTSLRKLEELADAVEDIARTGRLDVPVSTSGRVEVSRLAMSFNAMTSALARSRRRQQDLVTDAAHELRTPLTSLRTNVDLLLRSAQTGRALPPDQYRELLHSVQVQSRELGDLVDELVVLAREETDVVWEDVDLEQVVQRAVERARARSRGHIFAVETTSWIVTGDPTALERAVLNVLDNAVKFSPDGSTISVRITIDSGTGATPALGVGVASGAGAGAGAGAAAAGNGSRVVTGTATVAVIDQGPGIAEEERAAVFDRFWRSPTSRGLPGSGLGLAIVAETVAAHGGSAVVTGPISLGASGRLRVSVAVGNGNGHGNGYGSGNGSGNGNGGHGARRSPGARIELRLPGRAPDRGTAPSRSS